MGFDSRLSPERRPVLWGTGAGGMAGGGRGGLAAGGFEDAGKVLVQDGLGVLIRVARGEESQGVGVGREKQVEANEPQLDRKSVV